MSTTTPIGPSTNPTTPPVAVVLVLVAVALVRLAGGADAAPTARAMEVAASVPSAVLPAPDATGADVVIEPAVARAPEGEAELDVVLGPDAPGDVVIELSPRHPEVAADGTVSAGAPAADVRVSSGARLRPGERLRVTVTNIAVTGDPVVVVARVHAATPASSSTTAAGAGAGDDPVEVAALVLPGAPGPPPEVTVEVADGRVVGTVTVTSPLLVTARLTGAARTTHPERLVVPTQPLVLEGPPARWPSPSVLTVTDEAGRTVTVDTGRTALVAIAATLLAAAVAGAAAVTRSHRRRAG